MTSAVSTITASGSSGKSTTTTGLASAPGMTWAAKTRAILRKLCAFSRLCLHANTDELGAVRECGPFLIQDKGNPYALCSTRAGGDGLKWWDALRPDAIRITRRAGRVKSAALFARRHREIFRSREKYRSHLLMRPSTMITARLAGHSPNARYLARRGDRIGRRCDPATQRLNVMVLQ